MKSMSLFILVLFLMLKIPGDIQGQIAVPEPQAKSLVRIVLESRDDLRILEDLDLDLASRNLSNGLDVIVTGNELREIERRGFSYEILVLDPSLVEIDPAYRDYEETLAYLDTLHQQYPNLTHLEQIGTSQQYDIPIWAMKISDNVGVDEDEGGILFDGVHHAREPLGNEICLGIALTLLEGYGVDPQITAWVDSLEIWIVPIVNTEGYKYIMDYNLEDPWWRKNMRDNNENGRFDDWYDGVDLNRNYDFNWELSGFPNPWNKMYKGPYPASESEITAMTELTERIHRFILSITYHSFGEIVGFPWYWPLHDPPDLDVMSDVAENVASRIERRDGSGTYTYLSLSGLMGSSLNWQYGVMGTIQLLIETGTEFFPEPEAVDSIVATNIDGAFYLLDRALLGPGITGHVRDYRTGAPLQATVTIIGRDSDDIAPRTTDPVFGRYFRLLPPGDYTVKFEREGYHSKMETVTVGSVGFTVLDIDLRVIPGPYPAPRNYL